MKILVRLGIDKEIATFIRKGLLALISRTSGAVAVFLMYVFLARKLGVHGFGLFSLSITLINVIAVFGRFGMDTLVMRAISSCKESDKKAFARNIANPIFKLLWIITSILMLLIIFGVEKYSNLIFGKPELSPVLLAISPLLAFMIVGYVLGDAFKGIGYSSSGVMLQNSLVPGLFLLGVFVFPGHWFATPQLSALNYSITSIVILVGAIYFWMVITTSGGKFFQKPIITVIKEGVPLLMVSSGGLLVAWTDILVLGIFESEVSIGLYSAASKVAMLISLILVAVNAVVAPKFASYLAAGNLKKLKSYVRAVSFLTLGIAIIPSLLIVIFPEELLSVFGESYTPAKNILVILSLGQLVNVACGSVGYLLVMANHEVIVRNVIWFVAAVNLFLSIYLVNIFGVIGVAYATAISVSLWNLLLVFAVKAKLGFWMLGKVGELKYN